jgi:hypothetical protein
MCSDKNTVGSPQWVSPFGNLRIKAWLTAPRSLWQSSASFIAYWCQGIHQMPFSINHKFADYPWRSIFFLQIFQRSQVNFFTTTLHQFIWTHEKNLVEVSGFEPLTFRVQNGRSTNWAIPPLPHGGKKNQRVLDTTSYGGPKSTRTTDLPVISGVL